MSDKSKIEWCDATLNVFRGCSKVSAGCKNCYAEAMAARFHKAGQWGHGLTSGKRWTGDIQFVPEMLMKPFGWKKPRRIFLNSTSDTFHKNVKDEWLDQLFAMVALNPQHTFIVLTKRPERMSDYITSTWQQFHGNCSMLNERFMDASDAIYRDIDVDSLRWPLPNLWLGVSVEDQDTANGRIPLLLDTPAAVRFVSCEPLLGPVDLHMTTGIAHGCDAADYKLDWVIVGGESGPNARPMHPDWVRSLRDQCETAKHTPFFFKQWGEWTDWNNVGYLAKELCLADTSRRVHVTTNGKTGGNPHAPGEWTMYRVGKKAAGHLLDGVEHFNFPEQDAQQQQTKQEAVK